MLRIYFYYFQIRQKEASDVRNLNQIWIHRFSLQKSSLQLNLHFRHYFLKIMPHFLLKLKLKMKAESEGEIKLGKTENKWICRKNCGCKPRVHTCTPSLIHSDSSNKTSWALFRHLGCFQLTFFVNAYTSWGIFENF